MSRHPDGSTALTVNGGLTVIAGPTASGKTALAIRLAQRTGAEIVSADSQQVYRHFDIGTAKPSAEELAAVPHHLISVVDPLEPFSAARFQALADQAIAQIRARGRKVIVVGGTGMYLRILLHGVVAAPPAEPLLRARLEEEGQALGWPALHQRLAQIDPESAARIQPADRVRIVRALEIHALTGRPASAWRGEHGFTQERHPFQLFVLDPPREALNQAIDARARALFDRGLLEEVEGLVARGYAEAAPMRSVGYKEALAVVRGALTREEAIRLVARDTRHYAKRQRTWFRKEPAARFLAPPYAELSYSE
jgi:tRNA dimethylallyltransferase